MGKVIEAIADITDGDGDSTYRDRRLARFVSSSCPGWVSRISKEWDYDEPYLEIDVCIKGAMVNFIVRRGWSGPEVTAYVYDMYDINAGCALVETSPRYEEVSSAAKAYVEHVRNWLMSEVSVG